MDNLVRLDPMDSTPGDHRVAQITEVRIVSGRLIPSDPLPTEIELAAQLGVQRSPRARFRLLEAHRRTFEAIEAGNAGQAERWTRRHIEDSRRGYVVAGMDFKGPIKFNARCQPAKPWAPPAPLPSLKPQEQSMRPDPQSVRHVACIGAGTIGAGWAAYFLSRGLSVAVTDPGPGAAVLLRRMIDQCWPSLEALGLPAGADRTRLCFVPTVAEAVKDAGFVQENAPDRLELKQELLAEADRLLPPEVVIASSTSTFLPSALGARCRHAERIIVGHPFAPPHLIPLVEVVGAESTPAEVLDWAFAFYAAIGKRPLKLKKEIQSFIANRLQYAIREEANRLIDSGVCDYADIDTAMTEGIGLRWAFMGPAMCAHLGGGKGGLEHQLAHLGWRGSAASKASIEAAVTQTAGGISMDDLEHWRDANLVAQRKALKPLKK